jgi:hypothetical protein
MHRTQAVALLAAECRSGALPGVTADLSLVSLCESPARVGVSVARQQPTTKAPDTGAVQLVPQPAKDPEFSIRAGCAG